MRGRAKRGERCRAPIPRGHWKRTTFTGALRLRGITAPMVLDGPMNGDAFRAHIQQVLVPTRAADDVIIMDDLSAHRTTCIREAIEAAGARLRYLPDFDPIENALSKLKALLRKAGARTLYGLWDAIRDALPQFTPA